MVSQCPGRRVHHFRDGPVTGYSWDGTAMPAASSQDDCVRACRKCCADSLKAQGSGVTKAEAGRICARVCPQACADAADPTLAGDWQWFRQWPGKERYSQEDPESPALVLPLSRHVHGRTWAYHGT